MNTAGCASRPNQDTVVLYWSLMAEQMGEALKKGEAPPHNVLGEAIRFFELALRHNKRVAYFGPASLNTYGLAEGVLEVMQKMHELDRGLTGEGYITDEECRVACRRFLAFLNKMQEGEYITNHEDDEIKRDLVQFLDLLPHSPSGPFYDNDHVDLEKLPG